MIAVIILGGKQHLVKVGDVIQVEKLSGEKGKTVDCDPLLLADEKKFDLGMPKAQGKVVVEIIEPELKGPKIRTTKFRPKNRYHKVVGHRQRYTKVKVKSIA